MLNEERLKPLSSRRKPRVEDVSDVVLLVVPLHQGQVLELGGQEEDEEVEGDVHDDEGELQGGELPRLVLEAQACEKDGLEGVEGDDDGHGGYILRVVGVAHGRGDGAEQRHHRQHEQHADAAHGAEGGGEDAADVGALAVGEVEEGGLHAEGEDDQQEGGVGVDVGDDAVAAGGSGDVVGVERHEQVVEEPADDAAEAVDDRIGKEFLQ